MTDVVYWNASVKFRCVSQARDFAKKLIETEPEPTPFQFEVRLGDIGDEYWVHVEDIPWSHTLLQFAEILKSVDCDIGE